MPKRRITDLATHPHAFVTVPAFAEHVSVKDKMVRKWIRAGVLPAYRFSGQWRISKADAIAFVERGRLKRWPPDHKTRHP